MSYVFDQERNLSYVYRNLGGTWDTTNYAGVDGADLFPDDAQVGDFIMFGARETTWSFHDLKFNVGTALAATSITVAWEYWSLGTWKPIPGVVDGTDAFRNTGVNTVAFDVPENMCATSSAWYKRFRIGGSYKYAVWVRARIDAVNGITEGGATTIDRVTASDFTIMVTDEAMTVASLQAAADAGGWQARAGVDAVETVGEYTIIRPHLYMKGTSSWTDTKKMIELGEAGYPQGWRNTGSGVVQFGIRDANGTGDEGCYLYAHARYAAGYDYVWNLQCYATTIRRRTGQYGALALMGVFKFVDSVFISDSRWYLTSSVKAGSEWTRSLYANGDLLYLYSKNLAIDTFKMQATSQGFLCGGSAVIANTDIAGKKLLRYYSADITLIDCGNIDRSKITSVQPRGSDRHVWQKYHVDVLVLDTGANPIQGATVTLRDTNGTVTFQTVTAADGTIPQQLVTVYDKWWESAASWALHEDDYNPFTLTVETPGYGTFQTALNIMAPVDQTVIIEPAAITTDLETM